MSELRARYRKELMPQIRQALGVKNPMLVPRLRKVVINMGFDSATDKDTMAALVKDLTRITGQAAVVTRARKSISNFKLRQGMQVGAKVTLRGPRMYDFLERLIHVTLPRIRDFRGLPPRAFDGRGNYTFGVQDQTVFPEIDPDSVKRTQGMDITVVTSARTDHEAKVLLKALGIPLAEEERGN